MSSNKDAERRLATKRHDQEQRAMRATAAFKDERETEGRALDAKNARLKSLRLAKEVSEPEKGLGRKG